jgi:proteasome lid subunit RPN8/RPN11
MLRFLCPDVTLAARQHAMAAYPHESCGGVTEDGYIAFRNVAGEPEKHFDCSEEMAPVYTAGRLLALIHSHPDGPLAPSPHDIAQQMAMDIPWGIVAATANAALDPYFWGESIEPPPLEGRDFRYGPSGTDGRGDCAAIVRDWYRIHRDIRLPEFPREDGFWKAGVDFYRRSMHEAGFARVLIPLSVEPQIGDVALLRLRSPAEPNHAAVYVGGGLILHHFQNRLSKTDPILRWRDHITDWFRHDRVLAAATKHGHGA